MYAKDTFYSCDPILTPHILRLAARQQQLPWCCYFCWCVVVMVKIFLTLIIQVFYINFQVVTGHQLHSIIWNKMPHTNTHTHMCTSRNSSHAWMNVAGGTDVNEYHHLVAHGWMALSHAGNSKQYELAGWLAGWPDRPVFAMDFFKLLVYWKSKIGNKFCKVIENFWLIKFRVFFFVFGSITTRLFLKIFFLAMRDWIFSYPR